MTFKNLFAPALGAALLIGLPVAASAQDELFVETAPVKLNPEDPSQTQVGELIFRGGLEIDPGEEVLGGFAGRHSGSVRICYLVQG